MNVFEKNDENKILILYWLIPATVILMSSFGIWYALTAPSVPITNPTVLQYIPDVSDKMIQHARWSIASGFIWSIFNIAFFAVFLQLGWSAKLRDFVQERSTNLLVQITLFTLIYSSAQIVIESPLMYFTGYWMSHYFGLSSQSALDWLLDIGKSFTLGTVLEAFSWSVFFLLVLRAPKRWPVILFLVSVPITLFMTYIDPLVFEPIFNKFEPMAPSQLQRDIKDLAVKAGIPEATILISDQHKRTNAINAYVNGIGSSARIVLWDTIVAKMPPEQILCVVAHEIGHYKYNHVLMGCALAIFCTFLTIPINYIITPRFFEFAPKSWQVNHVGDLAAIPVILLCSACFGFLDTPVSNFLCRHIEHDADMFAIHTHGDRINCAKAFASLAKEDLAEPNPPALISFWTYSHPPLAERIESAIGEK